MIFDSLEYYICFLYVQAYQFVINAWNLAARSGEFWTQVNEWTGLIRIDIKFSFSILLEFFYSGILIYIRICDVLEMCEVAHSFMLPNLQKYQNALAFR